MRKYLILLFLVSVCTSLLARVRPHSLDIIPVDTIAELRLLKPTIDGTVVGVSGYNVPYDGCGGRFIYKSDDSSADNAGTIIQPDGCSVGRWRRMDVSPNVVNVRHFGAIGDATIVVEAYNPALHTNGEISSYTGTVHTFVGSDDTAAFQRAYQAIESGNTMYIPSGRYVINGNDPGWNSDLATRPGMVFKDVTDVVISGDGTTSVLCVTFDSSGETTTESGFYLFHFLDAKRCLVKDLHIDFQCTGFSTAQISGLDDDTKLISVITVESSVSESQDIEVSNCMFRVNHPFGSYFGEEWAAGKHSTKLFAIWFHGLYADPVPSGCQTHTLNTNARAVKNSGVTNCLFYEGQSYGCFFSTTENCFVKTSVFDGVGGDIPPIRGLLYNNFLTIVNNFLRVIPAFTDGSANSYCILISNNNSDYSPLFVKISSNSIHYDMRGSTGGSNIGAIQLIGTTNAEVDNNKILADETLSDGIRIEHYPTWAGIGDSGESMENSINRNDINGFRSGINFRSSSIKIVGNSVASCSLYGVLGNPYRQATLALNSVSNVPYGISIQRGGTSATGTAFISNNRLSSCAVGFAPTFATDTLDILRNNSVINCATGSQNLKLGNYRIEADYYYNNTVDLDSTSITTATGSISLGGGTIYGDPSFGY